MIMDEVEEDVELIRKAGSYENDTAVIEDALRSLLRSNPRLRTELAVEKYRTTRVSRNRAAEIAELAPEEFKEPLHERGIPRTSGVLSTKERDRKLGEL